MTVDKTLGLELAPRITEYITHNETVLDTEKLDTCLRS